MDKTELLEQAAIAMVTWFDAEDRKIAASFNDKMDYCKYAEYCARKALGQDVTEFEKDGEFVGVPRLVLKFK